MTYEQMAQIVVRLTEEERFEEARQLTLSAKAQYEAIFLYNLGTIAHHEGKLAEAAALFEQAIALAPHNPLPHVSLSYVLLTQGDFSRGWREFEWRLKILEMNLAREFKQPRWTGEQDLAGKTILLHAEGGHGDALHFCRYAPMAAQRGARVLLECHAALVPLLSNLAGVTAIFPRGSTLPPFDFHCPLQSLPLAFGTTLQSIPHDVPYVRPAKDLVEQWAMKLGPRKTFRAGLCWSGGRLPQEGRSRSLATFVPLAQARNVEFHSLQAGPEAYQPRPAGFNVIDHAAELTDFAQAAALAAHMDLIISVDTGIAHLGGAMGKETWVLVPKNPDFRWLLDRTDSPWYPTMRLCRQNRADKGWAVVAGQIAVELQKRV